jgi:hypothetical protein
MTSADALPPLDQAAWDLWVDYRKRILKKPLNPLNYENTQRGMRRFGADQMAVVQQSMEREWQGLFDLKNRATVAADPNFDPQAPW